MLYHSLLAALLLGSLAGAYFLLIGQPRKDLAQAEQGPATEFLTNDVDSSPEAVAAVEQEVVEAIKQHSTDLTNVKDSTLVDVIRECGQRESSLKGYTAFLSKLLADAK